MNKAMAVSVFLGMSLLQACNSYYVEPGEPDAAVLTVKNNTNRPLWFITYDKAADCSGRVFMSPKYPGIPVAGELSIKVKPSEPFSFYMEYVSAPMRGGLVKYCDISSTFTPMPNAHYTVDFSRDNPDRCLFPMTVKTVSGEARELSYKKRETLHPMFFNIGAHCK